MYRREVLDNGLRVITEVAPHVGSASIGFWVHAGSRWETPEEAGISHFLEHMLFKGTESRTARDIAEELDFVGGSLNAFTDKEATCYHAKVLTEHLPLAIDVLSDMLLHSQLDLVELEREKNVILEEIKQHEDDPESLIHDLLAGHQWPGHPLGRPVIGTPETVGAVTPDSMRDYLSRWYAPERVVVTVAGNFDPSEVTDLIAAAFKSQKRGHQEIVLSAPLAQPGDFRISKETEQMNLCIGWPGLPQTSEDRYTLACLDVSYGGGMSSRLFQEIRENRGLAYSVGSYASSYHEGGSLTVFAGTSPETLDEVVGLVQGEADNISREGLTAPELERAKNQMKCSLLMGLESMGQRMSRLGKTELYFGRLIPVEEVVEEIMAVTAEDVERVAKTVLGSPSTLTAIGPFDEG